MFEHGQPAQGEPTHVAIEPLQTLTPEAVRSFETIDYGPGWPEVGSRLMSRLVSGEDMRKRRLKGTGFQLDGWKFQGSKSSMRCCGWPAAMASSVVFR